MLPAWIFFTQVIILVLSEAKNLPLFFFFLNKLILCSVLGFKECQTTSSCSPECLTPPVETEIHSTSGSLVHFCKCISPSLDVAVEIFSLYTWKSSMSSLRLNWNFNMEIYDGYVVKFVLSCWGKIGKISVKNLISFPVSYYKVSTIDWTKKLLKRRLSETLSSPFLNYIFSPNI